VNVTTHRGAEGRAVDLCLAHGRKATALLYLGASYFGVSHGLHAGECAECLHLASGEATDSTLAEERERLEREQAGAR